MEQKLSENAAKLIHGTLDDTSLLALAIGQKRLTQQCNLPAEASIDGPAKSGFPVELGVTLASIDQNMKALLAKFGSLTPGRIKAKKKRKPAKREAVIFAAIVDELKGMKYCSFLQNHAIKPKWSDPGPLTYPSGYQAGNPWRKKIQDEKTRAKQRMNSFADSELAEVFTLHLPEEFEELSRSLRSRNSRHASKNLTTAKPHKR